MSKIKVMSEDLANKIAAGEVVERTMNVVKELVENAIDAKSTEIKIELTDSGVKEIKITDNGIGMDKDDALLAFSRHATSKLKTLEDLFHIDSLGFRGEALPSIAAVSKVILQTSNGEVGTIVEIDGGKVTDVSNSELRKGTSITVRDLFYNTPVRLKYLKNLYTELSNIVDYVGKMALSYPNIKFTLKNNDKLLLSTDGSDRLLKVIHAIYGLEVTKKMIEIQGENDDYYISGYISYPEVMKSSRSSITTLVNGRVIRNNDLNRMIVDCYHTYMPSDKYPIVVVNIEVDPILIDINIHPTKMDIKFSKIETLKELITEVITSKLEKKNLISDASFLIKTPDEKTETKEKMDIKVSTKYSMNPTKEFDIAEKDKEFEELTLTLEAEVEDSDISYQKEERIKEMYPVGLVHGTYVIAENEDGMFVIDQHAANERINYEKYLREMSKKERNMIDLLIPINIELPTNEYIILKENLNILTDLGFEIEEFGLNSLVVRSVPVWLPTNTKEAIDKIIGIIVLKEDFSIEKFVEKVAITLACKMSIKANDHITMEDMKVLLTRLRNTNNPFTCPHGRPTIITFSKYELERLFKRSM